MLNIITEKTNIIMEKIEEYENIALFFHERPDFDTLGSCYAIKAFIKDNFKNKNVKVIGCDTLSKIYGSTLFDFNKKENKADKNFFSNALAIISDTADSKRVYSQKFLECKTTIRVDHHPQIENFCDIELIDPMMPATCQIWADIFYTSKKIISSECAKYLYAGILTDTGRFLHVNTLPSTYEIVARLVQTGFSRVDVHDAIYARTKKEILFNNYLSEKIVYKKDFVYLIIPKGTHKKFNIYPQMSMVNLLSDIKGSKIWFSLYFDESSKSWKGSLRSKDIQINQIAKKFGGGGHKFAAGFSLKKLSDYKILINDLKNYLNEIFIKK